MRDTIIIIVALIACACLIIFTDFGNSNRVVYDCRLSEISPDFPIKVREECRNLRKQRIENYERKDEDRIHENSSNLLRT